MDLPNFVITRVLPCRRDIRIKIFHLNGHTIGFCPQVQNYKLIPHVESTHHDLSFEWSHFVFS